MANISAVRPTQGPSRKLFLVSFTGRQFFAFCYHFFENFIQIPNWSPGHQMIIKVISWCRDDRIKSSSRKRRQISSKTVVRPKALLSFHFISSPDVVKRYLNMVVVVVNQSCHQDNMALHAVIQDNNVVWTHIPFLWLCLMLHMFKEVLDVFFPPEIVGSVESS